MCEVCVRLCLGKSNVTLKGFIVLYIFHHIRKYIQVSVESCLRQLERWLYCSRKEWREVRMMTTKFTE